MKCSRCGHVNEELKRLFCQACGKVMDPDAVRSVRLMGLVGVKNSMSPKIEKFWQTGDPSVFASPGAKDYRP